MTEDNGKGSLNDILFGFLPEKPQQSRYTGISVVVNNMGCAGIDPDVSASAEQIGEDARAFWKERQDLGKQSGFSAGVVERGRNQVLQRNSLSLIWWLDLPVVNAGKSQEKTFTSPFLASASEIVASFSLACERAFPLLPISLYDTRI